MQSNKRPNWLTRRLIIDPKLQFTVLFHSLFLVMLTLGVVAVGRAMSSGIFLQGFSVGWGYPKIIAGVLIFGILFLAIASSMELTNRIAGPIHRIKQSMKQAAGAEIPADIQIRKGDQFVELATAYNQLLERLRKAEGKK